MISWHYWMINFCAWSGILEGALPRWIVIGKEEIIWLCSSESFFCEDKVEEWGFVRVSRSCNGQGDLLWSPWRAAGFVDPPLTESCYYLNTCMNIPTPANHFVVLLLGLINLDVTSTQKNELWLQTSLKWIFLHLQCFTGTLRAKWSIAGEVHKGEAVEEKEKLKYYKNRKRCMRLLCLLSWASVPVPAVCWIDIASPIL